MITYKQNEDEYDRIVEQGLTTFQQLVGLFLAGSITIAILEQRFKDALRTHFTLLMLAALGTRAPTDSDLSELNLRLAQQFVLVDGFMADLVAETISPNRALWRAGMYSPARGTFIFYTGPFEVMAAMSARHGLPGDICLGDGLCKCVLDITLTPDGGAIVNWFVSPETESCVVCLNSQALNPFIFTAEDLLG